jgi:hypothetical protein
MSRSAKNIWKGEGDGVIEILYEHFPRIDVQRAKLGHQVFLGKEPLVNF